MTTEIIDATPRAPRTVRLRTMLVATLATAIAGIVAVVLLLRGGDGPGTTPPDATTHAEHAATAEKWQCPMHPGITYDHPGTCPICGMTLVKISPDGDEHAGHTTAELATVKIDPARQQLIGLE